MIHYSKKNMYLADDENCLCIVPNKSLKLMCGKCNYNLKRTNENNTDSFITSITGNYFEKRTCSCDLQFSKINGKIQLIGFTNLTPESIVMCKIKTG